MRIDPFEYVKPRTVGEALAVLGEHASAAMILGGGSDLLVRMKQGIVSPRYVLDIKQLADLKYILDGGDSIRIGAATTLSAIERSPLIREGFSALATAAGKVASLQIRNAATLAGNVCLETMCWYYNQSRQWKKSKPACNKAGGELCYVVNKPNVCYATYRGDTAVALIALGASARVQSAKGERTIPLEDLFTGDGKAPSSLAPEEMITEFQLPSQTAPFGSAYFKLSHRNAVDYPLVSVGVGASIDPDNGRCADVRIVLGAVGSGPARAKEAEEMLRGHEPTADLLERAAAAAVKDAHPVNNMPQGSPSYRRKMVNVLALKALTTALEEARSHAG